MAKVVVVGCVSVVRFCEYKLGMGADVGWGWMGQM